MRHENSSLQPLNSRTPMPIHPSRPVTAMVRTHPSIAPVSRSRRRAAQNTRAALKRGGRLLGVPLFRVGLLHLTSVWWSNSQIGRVDRDPVSIGAILWSDVRRVEPVLALEPVRFWGNRAVNPTLRLFVFSRKT